MKRALVHILAGGAMALSSSLASAQLGPCDCPPVADRPIVEVGDAGGMGTGTVTWSCDSLYVLTETVFVNPGDALEIAKQKMNDLNAIDLEQAVKIIAGSARSMGIEVKE